MVKDSSNVCPIRGPLEPMVMASLDAGNLVLLSRATNKHHVRRMMVSVVLHRAYPSDGMGWIKVLTATRFGLLLPSSRESMPTFTS